MLKVCTRVSITVELEISYESRGDLHNLAYSDATVLNFGPAWPADVGAYYPSHRRILS